MNAVEAFKVGFVTKLAEHGLGLQDVIAGLEALQEKRAGVGVLAPAFAVTGASALIPATVGRGVGGAAGGLAGDEMDTLSQARKKLLIRQYKQLIAQRNAEIDNRLVSQAKREA